MAVDWNKYPPLPEPPEHLVWRDTPEREAYWNELREREKSGWLARHGCFAYLFLLATGIGIMSVVLSGIHADWFTRLLGITLAAAFMAVLVFHAASWGGILILKLRLAAKYGFYMFRLRRPDFTRKIGEILAGRPDFDAAAFHDLWPSEEYAQVAAELLELCSWHTCGKMLYPNDQLLLFFYGKTVCLGRNAMILAPGLLMDFYELVEEYFYLPLDRSDEIDFDSVSFAELVEMCVDCRSKHDLKA